MENPAIAFRLQSNAPVGRVAELGSLSEGRMTREIHIQSYFSLPTDLAGQLGAWPEFVAGEGYTAHLKDSQSGEAVDVALVEVQDERPSPEGRHKRWGTLPEVLASASFDNQREVIVRAGARVGELLRQR